MTNLPKEAMCYLDFPFPKEAPSFTTHAQTLDYISSYADKYGLYPYINFDCSVESVRPIEPLESSSAANEQEIRSENVNEGHQHAVAEGEGAGGEHAKEGKTLGKWRVVYRSQRHKDDGFAGEVEGPEGEGGTSSPGLRDRASGGSSSSSSQSKPDDATANEDGLVSEVFDAVCVCNGHFSVPSVPDVEGMEGFRGVCMHARAYDRPAVEAFIGRRVLCVGSRSSGADIAREVSSVGKMCVSFKDGKYMCLASDVTVTVMAPQRPIQSAY